MIGRLIAEGGVPTLGVVLGEIMADFQSRFGQTGEAAPVEQVGFEAAPKRLGRRSIVAIAPSTPTGQRLVAGHQFPETRGSLLAALVGVAKEPRGGLTPG